MIMQELEDGTLIPLVEDTSMADVIEQIKEDRQEAGLDTSSTCIKDYLPKGE